MKSENILYTIISGFRKTDTALLAVVACISIFAIRYFENVNNLLNLFPDTSAFALSVKNYLYGNDKAYLLRNLYWIFLQIIFFFFFPAIFFLRKKNTGIFTFSFNRELLWLSIIPALLMIVVAGIASRFSVFSSFYPFFKPEGANANMQFSIWLVFYGLHFFALEYFFRGLLVGQLSKTIGENAIWISLVPYMMIHLSKPWSEAIGSIVAGIYLGYLTMKTGSFIPGFFIHAAVAVSMDLFCY